MKAKTKAQAERQLIEALKARIPAARGGVRLGIGDDCAVLRPKPGHEVVVTTDLLLEGTHFRRDWHPAESAGHRCLARGLSDLAAMGASPLAAFLSIAVPEELARAGMAAGPSYRLQTKGLTRRTGGSAGGRSWTERFFDGLLGLAAEHGVTLAGGDTAQSPFEGVVADIVLLGQVPRGKALLRSQARAGDVIYVTGALGGSAAELLGLERGSGVRVADPEAPLRGRAGAKPGMHPQLFPAPRLVMGQRLRERGWTRAAIDISDGLSTDLDHLCEESVLGAEIDEGAIPVHALAAEAEQRGWASAIQLALHGGEDYELLFTAAEGVRVPKTIAGVPVRAIGRMVRRSGRGPRMVLRTAEGQKQELAPAGWEHFRQS